jgi:hypothetical protein
MHLLSSSISPVSLCSRRSHSLAASDHFTQNLETAEAEVTKVVGYPEPVGYPEAVGYAGAEELPNQADPFVYNGWPGSSETTTVVVIGAAVVVSASGTGITV